MRRHVLAVLVVQSALSMFFFWDSQLQGWQGVMVVLPLICVGMLVAQVRGLRVSNLWLLAYRQCSPGDMEEEELHQVTSHGSHTTQDELTKSLIDEPPPMGAEDPGNSISPTHDEG